MSDYFISDLQAQTSNLLDTDLWHIRTIGNIDYKVTGQQVQGYLKSPGHMKITFSNMGSSILEPKIQAGSEVAVEGTTKELVQFASETAGTGWSGLTDNQVAWMVVSPAGVVVFTQTVPSWDVSKHGWYSGTNRYVLELFKGGASLYCNKRILERDDLHIPKRLISIAKPITIYDANLTDITLASGTLQQRVIYCRDFHVTGNATLKCQVLICERDFIVDSGVTLTILSVDSFNAENDTRLLTDVRSSSRFFCGSGATSQLNGGGGALGGSEGEKEAATYSGGGGGSLAAKGGDGPAAGTAVGGYPFIITGLSFGGNGGNGGDGGGQRSGGGGAGPCAGAGGNDTNGVKANGGGMLWIFTQGNFLNFGTINNNGITGGVLTANGGSGGGGGLICIVSYGNKWVNSGSGITCNGGNGGNGTSVDGAGGGGGHIEVYAYLNSEAWGTMTAAAGAVGGASGSPAAGAAGTIVQVDLSTSTRWRSLLGGTNGSATTGIALQLCPIGFI